MKTRTCHIAILLAVSLISVRAQEIWTQEADSTGCLPPSSGLVSWWGGDEDTSDLQGNNPGTLTNGASYAPGFVSRAAFSFDGVDDVVQVGNRPNLKMTTAMTMECWIFPLEGPGSTVQPPILNKEGEYEIGRFSDGTIQWAFANTDPGWIWVNSGFVAPLGRWTHVAVTYDNGLITTYANGE